MSSTSSSAKSRTPAPASSLFVHASNHSSSVHAANSISMHSGVSSGSSAGGPAARAPEAKDSAGLEAAHTWAEGVAQLAQQCDIEQEIERFSAAAATTTVSASAAGSVSAVTAVPAVPATWSPSASCQRVVNEVIALLESLRVGSLLPSSSSYMAAVWLAQRSPAVFRIPTIWKAALALINTAHTTTTAGAHSTNTASALQQAALRKKSPLLPQLGSFLLDAALRCTPASSAWPLDVAKSFVADALDARLWCDAECCSFMVGSIVASMRDARVATAAPLTGTGTPTGEEENKVIAAAATAAPMATDEESEEEEVIEEESGIGGMSMMQSTALFASPAAARIPPLSSFTPSPPMSIPTAQAALTHHSKFTAAGARVVVSSSQSQRVSALSSPPIIPHYTSPAQLDELRSFVESSFVRALREACGLPAEVAASAPFASAAATTKHFNAGSATMKSSAMTAQPASPSAVSSLLRFLLHSVGFRSLRHVAVLNVEAWLANPVTARPARRLLIAIVDAIARAVTEEVSAVSTTSHAAAATRLAKISVLSSLGAAKSPWTDLAPHVPSLTTDTLNGWSKNGGLLGASTSGTAASSSTAVPIIASKDSLLDLQNIRLLITMAVRIKSGAGQAPGNAGNIEEVYLEAIARLLKGSSSTSTAAAHTSAPVGTDASKDAHLSLLLPMQTSQPYLLWITAFHSFLSVDWSHAASMQGGAAMAGGGSSNTSSSSSSSQLLHSPSHFILRLLDTLLRYPPSDGLSLSLARYVFQSVDRGAEHTSKIQFVLRRIGYLNLATMAAAINAPTAGVATGGERKIHHSAAAGNLPQAPAAVSSSSAVRSGRGFMDLFHFASLLLDYQSYSLHAHNVLLLCTEPVLIDEFGRPIATAARVSATTPAASVPSSSAITQYVESLHRFHVRRETIATEVVNLVVWSCIQSAQAIQCLQATATGGGINSNDRGIQQTHLHAPFTSAATGGPASLSLNSTPSLSLGGTSSSSSSSFLSHHSFSLMSSQQRHAFIAASITPSTTSTSTSTSTSSSFSSSSSRAAHVASMVRRWRFGVARIHAKAIAWVQGWLVGFLSNKPAPAMGKSEQHPLLTSANVTATTKDSNQLFSELLSNLLFLHSSPQQMLAPFLSSTSGNAQSGAASTTIGAAASAGTHAPALSKQPSLSVGASGVAAASAGAPTVYSSSASSTSPFLSELWPIDASSLRKGCSLLMDRLPLLEETISRLVMLSLSGGSFNSSSNTNSASNSSSSSSLLPRAHAIQILETLLRRVCLLSLSVGRKYDTANGSSDQQHNQQQHSEEDEEEGIDSSIGLVRIQNEHLLEGILQLSQFPTPIPPPTPLGASHPPLLALSSLFWRSCILLVILSAFNPRTIGRKSWEQVPTLRCLLEMAVSESWTATAAAATGANVAAAATAAASGSNAHSAASSLSSSTSTSSMIVAPFPPFPDLITRSLLSHKQQVEIDAILFVENLLPDNQRAGAGGDKQSSASSSASSSTPRVARTRENSLYLVHNYLMLLDPSEILRRPPEPLLSTLGKLVSDFHLGSLLRMSTTPNFLGNMLQRQTPEQYAGSWVKNLIVTEPESSMEGLPNIALAEVMLLAFEKAQFQPVPSVISQGGTAGGAAGVVAAIGGGLDGAEEDYAVGGGSSSNRKRKRERTPRPHSMNLASASGCIPSLSVPPDPLLDHLPALLTILRRTLPSIAQMYGMAERTQHHAAGTTAGTFTSPSDTPASASRSLSSSLNAAQKIPDGGVRSSSILGVLSPAMASAGGSVPPAPALPAPAATAAAPSSAATSAPVAEFNVSAFLELLSLFLGRLSSRSMRTRRLATHALHFWLCPQLLPHSFGGSSAPVECVCDRDIAAAAGGNPSSSSSITSFVDYLTDAAPSSSSSSHAASSSIGLVGAHGTIPATPPATCWLKFFFTWFLHAQREETGTSNGLHSNAPSSSSPPISPSFLRSGSLVISRVSSCLMSALEIESDPDTLLGYISFLHALGTRFVPNRQPHASKRNDEQRLFSLDLALRVCDVVMSREIVADKLMQPTTNATMGSGVHGASSAGRKRIKHDTDSSNSKTKKDEGADPLDLNLDGEGESDETYSGVAVSGLIDYSGYALLLSVLDSAYGVVEHMQDDEPLMRRMLARSGNHGGSGSGNGGGGSQGHGTPQLHPVRSGNGMRGNTGSPSITGTPMIGPASPPPISAVASAMDEEESSGVTASAHVRAPAPTSTPLRSPVAGGSEDMLDFSLAAAAAGSGGRGDDPGPPHPLTRASSSNGEGSNGAGGGAGVSDEEFVTLHRSWPSCTRPIFAYMPLPLLHGIANFLAFPYALPSSKVAAENQTPTPIQVAAAAYQHLLGLLLPAPAPPATEHAVFMSSSDASLPSSASSGSGSWLIDASGIRWPWPSDAQALKFLSSSRTPSLASLGIDTCPPNILMQAILKFGLEKGVVKKMLNKLDEWARYQRRMAEKSAPIVQATATLAGSNASASSSASILKSVVPSSNSVPGGLSSLLSPGMRDLLGSLGKLLQYTRWYQSLLQSSSEGGAANHAPTSMPGDALLLYLRSLDPAAAGTSTNVATVSTPAAVSTSKQSESLEDLATALRRLIYSYTVDAGTSDLSCPAATRATAGIAGVSLSSFSSLSSLSLRSPAEFLDLVSNCISSPSHAHPSPRLAIVWPLLQQALRTGTTATRSEEQRRHKDSKAEENQQQQQQHSEETQAFERAWYNLSQRLLLPVSSAAPDLPSSASAAQNRILIEELAWEAEATCHRWGGAEEAGRAS